jgi:hypothetical protein
MSDLKNIPIVITGTIIPNAAFVKHSDPLVRRDEYLKSIKFYSKFGKVFFLENSEYDLLSDKDFAEIEGLVICKFSPSKGYLKGKGYQEFEMIDKWISSHTDIPQRWIKISGRYRYINFKKIYEECYRNNSKSKMIIDQSLRTKMSYTQIFYIETVFYKEKIFNLYQESDDQQNKWIEHIIYNVLKEAIPTEISRFYLQPNLQVISGTSGKSANNIFKHSSKTLLRQINNRLPGKSDRYLFF